MFHRIPMQFLVLAMTAFMAFAAPRPAAGEAAFFGMQLQGMKPAMADSLGLDRLHGVLVRDVALGGPSDRTGFQRGDLITVFGGKKINTFKELIAVAGGTKAGQSVSATVLRNGSEVELELETGKWPKGWKINRSTFHNIPQAGLTLASLTPKVRQQFGVRWGSVGVLITLIDETKTAGMDLKPGELVVQVNQQPVWTPKQVARHYNKAKNQGRKSLLLLVEGSEGVRNGFRFSLLPVR